VPARFPRGGSIHSAPEVGPHMIDAHGGLTPFGSPPARPQLRSLRNTTRSRTRQDSGLQRYLGPGLRADAPLGQRHFLYWVAESDPLA
jgi:hypothetical protein